MAVELREVKRSGELRRFIMLPFSLYRNNPYWVPPFLKDEWNVLRRDRNPAYEDCDARFWLAYKDGRAVGRVAAIHNRKANEKWREKKLRFGWFDFTDDPEVSGALLQAVESWARELGLETVHGPLGFNDADREGMLIEGFDRLATLATNYNYPYYPQHMERLGYEKDIDWLEFFVKNPDEIPEKVVRVNELVLKRSGLRLLEAKTKKDFLPYVTGVFDVLNVAYDGLYGTTEFSPRQVEIFRDQYFGFIDPDFTKIVLDGSDKVVAFAITMPSLSTALQKAKGRLLPTGFAHLLHAMRHPKMLDLYLIGVLPEYQSRGVVAVMMTEINRAAIRRGVIGAETNLELETNKAVQDIWKHYEHEQHKRRRCYRKNLTAPSA